MKNLIGCLFLFFIFNGHVSAQEAHNQYYGLGGLQSIDVKNLNEVLNKNALPELNQWQYYMGFGGSNQKDNWVFGGEGYWMFSSNSNTSTELKMTGGMGYFYIGYAIVNQEKLQLIPKVGIGGGGMNLQFNQTTTAPTLEGFLTATHSNNITNGNLLNHFGMQIRVLITPKFDLQLGAGYNLGWGSLWSVENGTVSESVEDKIGGLFFQMSSGFDF